MKNLKDYKIFVFDLDNTILLHETSQEYSMNYNKKLKKTLLDLKANGKSLYIATHNFYPEKYLIRIGLSPSLFNGIIKETKDVHCLTHKIEDFTSKKDMVLDILKRSKSSPEEVLFFDDVDYNTKQVEEINVKSILVNRLTGIDLDAFN